MTPQEMKDIINKQREYKLDKAVLVLNKPKGWLPKGLKIRTPFGLGEIYSVLDMSHMTQVVFAIEITKMERYLKRLEKCIV